MLKGYENEDGVEYIRRDLSANRNVFQVYYSGNDGIGCFWTKE
jgi:hypothetical protein